MKFDCNALPACEITCQGPHKRKIDIVTKECGCTFEWLFHSMWLQFGISCTIFLLLNASRIFFIDGLARVLWKRLHPGTFTVWATCDESGVFISQSSRFTQWEHGDKRENENDSDESRDGGGDKRLLFPSKSIRMTSNIRNEIDRHAWYFKVGGWFMMVGALLVNIPWILLMIHGSDEMRPTWLFT